MSYEKYTWHTGDIIDAEKLNNIETGVENAEGADWDAEEGDSKYLDNKPFYSEIGTMPGLPKAFIDGLGFTFEDAIDSLGISDEQWEQFTGVSRSDCFASTGAIINYEQAKDMYFYTGQGNTYPGDAAIIAEYGSVQAYGQTIAEFIKGFLGKATYIGDFDYEPGELPNVASLINPVYTAEINSTAVSDTPESISESIALLGEIPTSVYDIWGNTGLYNGALGEVYYAYLGGGSNTFSLLSSISPHTNSDDYYFAIAKFYSEFAPGMVFSCYWYDLAFANSDYFTTSSVSVPVSHDWTTTSGAASGYQRYQVSAEKVNGKDPEITFSVSTDISTSISCGMYGYTDSSDGPIPDAIRLNINNYDEYNKYLQNSTTTPGIETDTFSSYSFYTNDKVNFTLRLNAEDSSAYAYVDVPDTWTVVTSITKSMGTTEFDYTLTSADAEIVQQIDNKFIPKPVWWFGDTNYIISQPVSVIKNLAAPLDGGTTLTPLAGYGTTIAQVQSVLDVYDLINLDYSQLDVTTTLSGFTDLAVKDLRGSGSVTLGFIKIHAELDGSTLTISSLLDTENELVYNCNNLGTSTIESIRQIGVVLGNGNDFIPDIQNTDPISVIFANMYGGFMSVEPGVLVPPSEYEELTPLRMADFEDGLEEALTDMIQESGGTEIDTFLFILKDITINEAYTASKLGGEWVDIDTSLKPAGTSEDELGGVYVPNGSGLVVYDRGQINLANASSTTVGGIKARVDGDTLYITTNGTNP